MEIKDMIWNGLMNAEYETRLKELKKGEYFRLDSLITFRGKKIPKSIFKKCSYDRILKKYECRPCILPYNAKKGMDRLQKLTSYEKRIYLEGSTLVRKNPQ